MLRWLLDYSEPLNKLIYLSILECLWQCCLNQIIKGTQNTHQAFQMQTLAF